MEQNSKWRNSGFDKEWDLGDYYSIKREEEKLDTSGYSQPIGTNLD